MGGVRDLSEVRNKQVRQALRQKQKLEAKQIRKQAREKRKRDAEALGMEPNRPKPHTIESKRTVDETLVQPDDQQVMQEDQVDEFSKYFTEGVPPKICFTTCLKPSKRMFEFIRDMLKTFPCSFFYERRKFPIKTIVEQAKDNGFTDIMIFHEDRKEIHSMILIHLPDGPTAYFKLSNIRLSSEIPGRGAMTSHQPEVILNNFNTRLGHRLGRMFASLFHQKPEFPGRRVVTFHNQRDFVFLRQHRYIFEVPEDDEKSSKSKKAAPKKPIARLQELGPQFTMKLTSLQHGTFDPLMGEYEFKWTNDMAESDRKRFFL